MKTASAIGGIRPRQGAGAGVLVDPAWLEDHLSDPHVRVVEVDVSPAAYDEGHIDGAVLWNIYADLKDAGYRLEGHRRAGTAGGAFGDRPGLDRGVLRVRARPGLVADEALRAPRCAHSRLLPRHLAGRRPPVEHRRERNRRRAASASAARTPASGPTGRPCARPSAGRARSWWTCAPRPSTGASASGPRAAWNRAAAPATCRRPSTSPSTASTTTTGRSAPPPSCGGIFARSTSTASEELITYCTIGGRAATAWFVLTYLLGRDHVRVYDGSWAEWGRIRTSPSRVRNSPPDKSASSTGGPSWLPTRTSCRNLRVTAGSVRGRLPDFPHRRPGHCSVPGPARFMGRHDERSRTGGARRRDQ